MAYPPSSSAASRNGPSTSSSPALHATNAPSGTFLPGTKVQVGKQRVTIEKYLSSGGFAHVYVVRVPHPDTHKHELAVLKRVAVPDKDQLTSMRTEVETMKKLKGHKHVVTYMDSHASGLKGGGYEVFLLMEFCSGGGLIDFMNTRLQHRLTEAEILKIFGDVAEGVAAMHYLKPPLLHRDLKVENVLIAKSTSGTPVYKLCDFGSSAPPRPAAKTADEGRLIEEDVQKHTTMQYRSPEMIDVWRKQPIDEKADIWALGVLLYKLCYYTTPFEDVGQMAILNANYKYPSYPAFSDRLKKLVGRMLKEDPEQRLNVYQVIKEVCAMQGSTVPIKDIYAQRTQSQARRNVTLPSAEEPMAIGLQKEAPKVQVHAIPDIAPMRRGRPTAPSQQAPMAAAKPSPSPARGDPFAALDSKSYDVRVGAVDELSNKFPSLDEFSIAHEKGGAFDFPAKLPSQQLPKGGPPSEHLNVRVTNALADEVFKNSQPTSPASKPVELTKARTVAASAAAATRPLEAESSMSSKSQARDISQQSPTVRQPTPAKSGANYASTGTGSSPPTSTTKTNFPDISSRPIWKVPDPHRSSSQPRASKTAQAAAALLQPSLPPTLRPALQDLHRSKSQTVTLNQAAATSSRPSLEGHRPLPMETGDTALARTKSAGASRQRPSSVYVSSNLVYLRDQESARKRPSLEGRRQSRQSSQDVSASEGEKAIEDDMDYLRNSEEEERRMHHRRVHSTTQGHKKTGSLHAIGSGARSVFAGAFKRFEHGAGSPRAESPGGDIPPSPLSRHGYEAEDEPRLLSPIEGSVATLSKGSQQDSNSIDHNYDSDPIDETEDLPPDLHRELERTKLEEEERRVEAAAAEYKARMAERGGSGTPSRASTIQRRVQSLLDEAGQPEVQWQDSAAPMKAAPPPLARKPVSTVETSNNPYPKTRQQPSDPPGPNIIPSQPASAPPIQTTVAPAPAPAQARLVSRPSVPPKSQALRTGGSPAIASKPPWPPAADNTKPAIPTKLGDAREGGGGLAALLAKDLEGVPDYPRPPRSSGDVANKVVNGAVEPEGPETDFSTRHPRLGGIEMVETKAGGHQTMREV